MAGVTWWSLQAKNGYQCTRDSSAKHQVPTDGQSLSFLPCLCHSQVVFLLAGHIPSNRCPKPWLHVSIT